MPPLDIDIEALIPHRDRMKLISDVLDIDADTAITSSIVNERWPLCNGYYVDPVVLIEVVAQTAGIHISWKKGVEKSGGLGWLVGIKNAAFFQDRIPVDTELIATVKNLYSTEQYNVMEGTVTAGDALLCQTQIQIYRSDPE